MRFFCGLLQVINPQKILFFSATIICSRFSRPSALSCKKHFFIHFFNKKREL